MEEGRFHECEQHENIAHVLHWLKNQFVEVIVSGGWLFTGTLVEIEEDQITLCDVTVTSCGGLTLSSFEVPRVTICKEAIISIGKPGVC